MRTLSSGNRIARARGLQTNTRSFQQCFVHCLLVFVSILNIMTTVGILSIQIIQLYDLNLGEFSTSNWNTLMWQIIIAKCVFMSPFITYEYYLIMFEHLFVDTSHYMGSVQSLTFISMRSPVVRLQNYSSSSRRQESKVSSANRLRELNSPRVTKPKDLYL